MNVFSALPFSTLLVGLKSETESVKEKGVRLSKLSNDASLNDPFWMQVDSRKAASLTIFESFLLSRFVCFLIHSFNRARVWMGEDVKKKQKQVVHNTRLLTHQMRIPN